MKQTKTIGFLLSGVGLSGGVHIVLRWAQALASRGHRVYVVCPGASGIARWPFLGDERIRFFAAEPHVAASVPFDVLFATWWQTLFELPRYRARTYAWLVQALEAQFYPRHDPTQAEYEALALSGVSVVTIAHWLRDYFVEHFGYPKDDIPVVLNPLDKTLWRPTEPLVPRGGTVRFLVEGRHSEARKNVVQTMRLLDRAGVEYIWVGAETDASLAGPMCVRVLTGVPYEEMPRVYASADVLVKLSDAEGMFGPPLEMFASGGTAIAWDVAGAEEYLTHGYNAWLAPLRSEERVLAAIERLRDDPALLARLKENARKTAEAWPTWPAMVDAIEAAVLSLKENAAPQLAARIQVIERDKRERRFPAERMNRALERTDRLLTLAGAARRKLAAVPLLRMLVRRLT